MRKLVHWGFAATLAVLPATAHSQDYPGGGDDEPSHIQRPPREPRGPTPLTRKTYDKLAERMFREGDSDHDGTISLAELNGEIQSLKDRAIEARFTSVDSNRDGAISKDEFFAWQRGLGSTVLAQADQAGEDTRDRIVPANLPFDVGRDFDDQQASLLLEPLSTTLIAAANVNYDGGMSLEEFLAYEDRAFDKADGNADGFVTPDELRAAAPRSPGPRAGSDTNTDRPRPTAGG